MNKFNTNHSDRQQRKFDYNDDIQEARNIWHARKKELLEVKERLGYDVSVSVEAFLKILPDASAMVEVTSQLLMLQKKFEELEEDRQRLWAEELVVEELNKHHAVVHTDQFYVLTEKTNPVFNGNDFTLESKQSFKSLYENKLVQCPDDKMRSKADIWLKSPARREFLGIIFDPKQDVIGYYNLWKGFAKEPKEGDCSKYWDHVFTNICNKNNTVYVFVRKWMAFVFQYPDEVHTALVLCGSQGVGKNSFVEPIGTLLGQHYVLLSSISELVSHFNYHLKHAVLIHANEALWGGDRRDIGLLKAMITERTCLIEGKGKDRFMVRNFKHVILSSNEQWPVHLDPDDRRFFVLKISDEHKENHQYFAAIEEQLKAGGYEALLFDLLNERLEGFSPRVMPENVSAFDIKIRSACPSHKYVYEALIEGCFDIGVESPGMVWQDLKVKDVFDDYCAWCKTNGEKNVNKELFSKELQKLIPSIKIIRPREGGKRPRKYCFPDFDVARMEFCKLYKAGNTIWKVEEFDDN